MSKYNDADLTLVPPEIYRTYTENIHRGSMICECGHLNEDIILHPYAYDKEDGEVVFISFCNKCSEPMFIRS